MTYDAAKRIEQLSKQVDGEKAAIVEAVTSGHRSPEIAKAVANLAYVEGRLTAAHQYESNGESGVIGLVMNGPGDTWSGRTNDLRRSHYDGLLAEAETIRRGY